MVAPLKLAERGSTQVAGIRQPLLYELLVLNDGANPVAHGPAQIEAANAAGYPPLYCLVRIRCPANQAAGGVCWRADGVAPALTGGVPGGNPIGMPSEHGTEEDFTCDPANLQFIQLTADETYVHIHYFY